MALHYNDGRQTPVKSRDIRICHFYLDWLGINKNIRPEGINRQDAGNCHHAVNQLINQYYPDKEQQNRLMTEMNTACDENILPAEHFDWLEHDERAAFWLWGYLYTVGDLTLGISSSRDARYDENWYQFLQLSKSPASHQERMQLLFNFFDWIIIPAPPVNHLKSQVMDRLKDQWKNIYSKPVPLKWLPVEEEAVLWAWNSLKSLQEERNAPTGGLSFMLSSPGLSTWFTPLNHSERNLALRAAIDLWDDAPDTKRLFLLNLNKAWNQQKLRQSRTDKKALNTYLKNETKMRLDFMAERSGVRISDMLETLINDHYLKTCGGE
ncbi:hypothetical protein I1A46_14785 [Serratia liquefaciens]|uniref:hypothetical protein n=1 Tax=Enterobacterales TaxID=91347 RepID=UPI0015770790|nr:MULTISPECIES: hypothetical protein [Enterobacterales]MBF8106388.1 hypothetical protein [Serratia liquefaciens]NTZ45461.1 hypothetical protein [Lelliottia aquatilis]